MEGYKESEVKVQQNQGGGFTSLRVLSGLRGYMLRRVILDDSVFHGSFRS